MKNHKSLDSRPFFGRSLQFLDPIRERTPIESLFTLPRGQLDFFFFSKLQSQLQFGFNWTILEESQSNGWEMDQSCSVEFKVMILITMIELE